MATGHEVTERHEPNQPPLHLSVARLDGQVDVVAGVVLAYADRATLDLEPAFSVGLNPGGRGSDRVSTTGHISKQR